MKTLVCRAAFVLVSTMVFVAMASAQKGGAEVKGLLWNAACKNGIPDAQIVLSDGKKKYKTKSDGSGKYLIRNVRPGKYEIVIARYGFLNTVEQEINIVESESRTLNYEMRPGLAPGEKPRAPNTHPCDYSSK